LKTLIAKTDIQFSESFEVDGPEMFAHACKVGLEGVVSKVRDSRYVSGRGNNLRGKETIQIHKLLNHLNIISFGLTTRNRRSTNKKLRAYAPTIIAVPESQ
jgi:hypothetical protein